MHGAARKAHPRGQSAPWVSRPGNAGSNEGWMLISRSCQCPVNQGLTTRMKPARQTRLLHRREATANRLIEPSRGREPAMLDGLDGIPAAWACLSPAASRRWRPPARSGGGNRLVRMRPINAFRLEPRPEIRTAVRMRAMLAPGSPIHADDCTLAGPSRGTPPRRNTGSPRSLRWRVAASVYSAGTTTTMPMPQLNTRNIPCGLISPASSSHRNTGGGCQRRRRSGAITPRA